MNQRGTHFHLGTTSQNYQSVYHKDYDKKQAQNNQVNVSNPFRGGSLNHNDKGYFTTTNKVLMKAWDNREIAKLDDSKLKELRTHHFKLGTYNPHDSLTTNKLYHDRKNISGQASKNQEQSKNKMRGHNHDFKEQNHTNYKSSYSGQFTPKQLQRQGVVIQGQGENAICFGTQALPLLTTNHTSYTPKEAQRAKVNPEPAMGVLLGEANEPKQTMNQLYFDQKAPSKAALPESTIKELRGTHFGMGEAPLTYQTESHNYRSVPGKSVGTKLNFKIPTYETGTWVDKNAKFYGQTTNKRELPEREVKPFEKASQANRGTFQIGGHTGSYTSEFKSNYGQPGQRISNNIEINKKSNVVIGGNERFFTTEQKSSFKSNNLKEGRVDIDVKKLNIQDHFKIGGNTNDPKLTVFQDEFRQDLNNRSKIFHKSNQ